MPSRITLLLALLFIACSPAISRAQDYFWYYRESNEQQPDADFESVLEVKIYLLDGKLTVSRGPTWIFGIKGEARTFQGGNLECELRPEEVKEIRGVLDGLEMQRLPEQPEDAGLGPGQPYYGVTIEYGGFPRPYFLTSRTELPRKIDEAVEGIVKKITARESGTRRYWQPTVRTFPGDDQPVRTVPLAELVADPLKFHRQRVRVTGLYKAGWEESSLSDGDAEVWLGGDSSFADKKELDPAAMNVGATVTVEGTFDAGEHGHMGVACGSILRVTRRVVVKDAPPKAK